MGNGLTTEEQKTIAAVFAQVPAIERAVLFGSRAMGLARSNSDVDIALYGEKLGLPDILHTASLLEETPLPYQFDLISHSSITSPELFEHIRQHGKEMYRKESNSQEKCSSERYIAGNFQEYEPGCVCTQLSSGKGISSKGVISDGEFPVHGGSGKFDYQPLSNYVDVKGGKRLPKGKNLTATPTAHPYIRVRDLGADKVLELTSSHEYVDDETHATIARYTVNAGDVIISIVGTIGLVAIIGKSLDGANLTENCAKMVNIHGLDRDFLYYYLLSDDGQNAIRAATVGAVQAKLPLKNIQALPIPTLSLSEQRTIAATLSSLDDKIENNRKINQCLEQMAQAMFDRLIIEESIDEPLGVLADIAEINPPRMLKRGQNAAYVEMANLPTQGAFPNNWEIKSFTGGMKFKNGDTIFARISPCLQNGKTAYINFLNEGEVAFGSTEYIVISSKKDYCNEMFYFLARYPDFVNYAVGNMNGSSGRQRVSGNTLENYELHIPTKENVRKFAMFATPVMNIILQNSLENRNLAALRDALLPRLMSGELSVGDVEAS